MAGHLFYFFDSLQHLTHPRPKRLTGRIIGILSKITLISRQIPHNLNIVHLALYDLFLEFLDPLVFLFVVYVKMLDVIFNDLILFLILNGIILDQFYLLLRCKLTAGPLLIQICIAIHV